MRKQAQKVKLPKMQATQTQVFYFKLESLLLTVICIKFGIKQNKNLTYVGIQDSAEGYS